MTEFATLDTSMGTFGIRTSSVGVFRVHLPNDPQDSEWETPLAEQSSLLKQAMEELEPVSYTHLTLPTNREV